MAVKNIVEEVVENANAMTVSRRLDALSVSISTSALSPMNVSRSLSAFCQTPLPLVVALRL